MPLSRTAWTREGRSRCLGELCCLEKTEAPEIPLLPVTRSRLAAYCYKWTNKPADCMPSPVFLHPLIHAFWWDMHCPLLISVLINRISLHWIHSAPFSACSVPMWAEPGWRMTPGTCITLWLLTGFGQWYPSAEDWRPHYLSLFPSSSLP